MLQKRVSALVLALVLAACGGGGGEPLNAPQQATQQSQVQGNPSQGTPQGDSLPIYTDTGSSTNIVTQEESPPLISLDDSFGARMASPTPEDRAVLCEPFPLIVKGKGIQNVELVHTSDPIIWGRFTYRPEHDDWYLLVDQRGVAHRYGGVIANRVVAYDAPPGQPARSIEVMSPRGWLWCSRN